MISRRMRRTAPDVGAAILSLSLLAGSGLARADEIKVMASVALKSTLDDLAAKFESTGGGTVKMVYGLAAQLKQRVADGELDDVAVLIRPMMEIFSSRGNWRLAASPMSAARRLRSPYAQAPPSRILALSMH